MSDEKEKVEIATAAATATATVGAVLPTKMKELLVTTARAYGITTSALVRRAIETYFVKRPDIVAAVSDRSVLPNL